MKATTKKTPTKKATTKKVVSTATVPAMTNDEHLTIRKISNGYVVRESGTRNGQYFEKETFTKVKPKVTI